MVRRKRAVVKPQKAPKTTSTTVPCVQPGREGEKKRKRSTRKHGAVHLTRSSHPAIQPFIRPSISPAWEEVREQSGGKLKWGRTVEEEVGRREDLGPVEEDEGEIEAEGEEVEVDVLLVDAHLDVPLQKPLVERASARRGQCLYRDGAQIKGTAPSSSPTHPPRSHAKEST
jgi:hypothetical protein